MYWTSCAAVSPTSSPSARRRLTVTDGRRTIPGCRTKSPIRSLPRPFRRGAWPQARANGSRSGTNGRSASPASGRGAARPARACRVCILDSGVDARTIRSSASVSDAVAVVAQARTTKAIVEDDTEGDLCGHGTACAGIVRSLAPDCELTSVRVLGAGFTGSGDILLAGLRWAVEQGFDVVNMSLSTTKRQFAGILHELTDRAYFSADGARRLGAQHARRELPLALLLGHLGRQPRGAGADDLLLQPGSTGRVLRARRRRRGRLDGGARIRCTGNSFATPHMTRALRARPRQAPAI